MDDRQIIELYFRRDPDAIDRSAEKYGRYCGHIARNILNNEQDAEECVNDAWFSAWNSIPPRRPEHLGAYLGKLTRSKAIDRWRAQHRRKRGGSSADLALDELSELIPSGESPEGELMQKEIARTVNRFLAGLPETERSVFLCRYWYFEEIPQICARFGFSRSKVHSMLHRTRVKLRKYLQKEELL